MSRRSMFEGLLLVGLGLVAGACGPSVNETSARSSVALRDKDDKGGTDEAKDDEWKAKHCKVVGVKRRDYLIDFLSNLPSPNNQGPAKLDIHRVTPVFGELEDDAEREGHDDDDGDELKDDRRTRKCLSAVNVAVHGRSVDVVSVIDIQYKDYSLAESLAMRGIETFGVNLLGFGLSSRFRSMNNPCNAPTTDQNTLLKPPLTTSCLPTDVDLAGKPFVFSNIDAQAGIGDDPRATTIDEKRGQLGAAVDHALAMTGRTSISLFAWSRGAIAAGPYARQNPTKVKNIVFLAGSYLFVSNPTRPTGRRMC